MACLGLKFKVSKYSKNDYRTSFKSFYAKKMCLENFLLKEDKLLKSGGNTNFRKAKRLP